MPVEIPEGVGSNPSPIINKHIIEFLWSSVLSSNKRIRFAEDLSMIGAFLLNSTLFFIYEMKSFNFMFFIAIQCIRSSRRFIAWNLAW